MRIFPNSMNAPQPVSIVTVTSLGQVPPRRRRTLPPLLFHRPRRLLLLAAFAFTLFVTTSSQMKAIEDSWWDTIWDVITDVVDWIGDFVSDIIDAVCDLLGNIWDEITGFFEWLDNLNSDEIEDIGECTTDQIVQMWEGENPFTVYDGNVLREVTDLKVKGAAAGHFTWTRYHNTIRRPMPVKYFGSGGCWRHSWQYDLQEKTNPEDGRFLELTLPSSYIRRFRLGIDGTWAADPLFPEKIKSTADGYVVTTGVGGEIRFVKVNTTGGDIFQAQAVVDSHGLTTRLDYNADGFLTQVAEPAGRKFNLFYQQLVAPRVTPPDVLATITVAPQPNQWLEITVPAALQAKDFHALSLISKNDRQGLAFAEVQFFAPGSSTPLAGVSMGNGENLGAAMDGNPATVYSHIKKRGNYALGLPAGQTSKIGRIRVLAAPGQESALVGVEINGRNETAEKMTVLARVSASDGQSVDYTSEIQVQADTRRGEVALIAANYGDGSKARYKYSYAYNRHGLFLVEADDPRYNKRAKQIRYAYHQDRAPGTVHQEINPVTGGVYASLEFDPSDPDKRTVHYSDLRTVTYKTPKGNYGRPTERVDGVGRKTTFEYADNGKGRLLAKVDHAGRRDEFDYDDRGKLKSHRSHGRLKNQVERDANGRVKKTVDDRGRVTTYERDANGRLSRRTADDGNVNEFTYDSIGRVTALKAKDGWHRFTYDNRGNRVGWTSPKGKSINLTYDERDRAVKVVDPLGRESRRELNDRGLATKIYHRDGTTTLSEYDNYGSKIAETDAKGHTSKMAYDGLGRLKRHQDNTGRVTTYDYSELPGGCGSCVLSDRPTTIVQPDGTVTTRLYDGEGRLLMQTVAFGTPVQASTIYDYDNDNNLTSQKDPLGRVTRYTYNDRHERLTATDPLGRVTTWEYDDHGNIIKITAPDGGETLNTYDRSDRLVASKNALNETTRYGYDASGNRISMVDATGAETRYVYEGKRLVETVYSDGKKQTQELDIIGRVIRSTTPDGAITATSYDTGDHPLMITRTIPGAPIETSTFTYDSLGRRLTAIDPLGRTTRWTYDTHGNVLTSTRPDGQYGARNTYDAQDNLITTTDASGATTTFTYDAARNQTSLTDARGNTYRFTYDALHRKTSMSYPDGTQEKWTYDVVGNLLTATTRAGATKTITYNAGNQPLTETWSAGSGMSPVNYTYDAVGRIRTLDNSQAKLGYEYDKLGRLIAERTDLTALVPGLKVQAVEYNYDALGRRLMLTYPDQTKVGYNYDMRGRLSTIDAQGGGNTPLATYAYDAKGRLAKLTRDNGVVASYAYDMAGQLTDLTHVKGITVLADTRYTLDTLGCRSAQKREDNISETYQYDATSQLTGVDYGTASVGKETFAYDPVGNRQTASLLTLTAPLSTTTYTTNGLNQYTQTAMAGVATPFSYDVNGNLLNDGKNTYAYDAKNRLTTVETVGGALRPEAIRAEFFYDVRNRCVLRKYYQPGSQAPQWVLNTAESRALTYDAAWNLLTERTLDDKQVGAYIHGQRTDEILVAKLGATTVYPLTDGLGSTVALTDNKGKVTDRYRYTAYGQPTRLTPTYNPSPITNNPFRFLFTGREWLNSVQLNDHRNRYYSPSLGRWTSTDPIGFRGGDLNLYLYSKLNPISRIDSYGLESIEACSMVVFVGHNDEVPQGSLGTPPNSAASVISCGSNGQCSPAVPGNAIPGANPQTPAGQFITLSQAIDLAEHDYSAALASATSLCGFPNFCKEIVVEINCEWGFLDTAWLAMPGGFCGRSQKVKCPCSNP